MRAARRLRQRCAHGCSGTHKIAVLALGLLFLDKLDAQDSLLSAQLNRNAAIVDYAIARLQLMNDLEAIRLSPQGLRFDLKLPMPASAE